MRTAAVIVAAGKGRRMGSAVPKQFMELCGRPVLSYSIDAFERSSVDSIVIVTSAEDIGTVRDIVRGSGSVKVIDVIPGGAVRCDSCFAGISRVQDHDIVLIHDAARALVTPELIDEVARSAEKYEAVCPAVNVFDTMRMVGPDGFAAGIVQRELLRSIQTPQGFKTELIMEAYRRHYLSADRPALTDDAMAVEMYLNREPYLCEGSRDNIKLTTPDDILTADRILKARVLNSSKGEGSL